MTTHAQKSVTVYMFSNDLRLADNTALQAAVSNAIDNNTALLCLYCMAPRLFNMAGNNDKAMGEVRLQFLLASIQDLRDQLNEKQAALTVSNMDWVDSINSISDEYKINTVIFGATAGYDELLEIKAIKKSHSVITYDNQTMFDKEQLPMSLSDLPKHFTPFRKQVEGIPMSDVVAKPHSWPESYQSKIDQWVKLEPLLNTVSYSFKGGERAGLNHLKQYMSSDLPSSYKKVRNELMGWEHSTKFSAWLALGCISPRQIMQELNRYEKANGANDSTYWIFFELLWREFFHWNALKQGHRLFYSVKSKKNSETEVGSETVNKFKNWCNGTTEEPLINACMRELNQTGFMSNRGRQIAASFLVNEMNADWRLGASYFEQQLVDYDVASNWGNWQYIAGVGADPRGGRHFNIEKQQKTHDPNGCFVEHWANHKVSTETVTFKEYIN